jgi:hypothetical protein
MPPPPSDEGHIYILTCTVFPEDSDDEDEKLSLIRAYTTRLAANSAARGFLRRKAVEVGIAIGSASVEEWQSEMGCYGGVAAMRGGEGPRVEVGIVRVPLEEEQGEEEL